jgi:hypothetical protein
MLGAITLVTALLVFLLARPEAEPATKQRPPSTPGATTSSQPIVMPDLRGLTYDEAHSRLNEMDVISVRRVEAQGESGIVVATDPSLGQLVPAGTPVTVFVGADQPAADEEALTSV